MRLEPVNDKIVVKPEESKGDEKTASGIILPESQMGEGMVEAEVLAISDGMYTQTGEKIPPIVEVGDRIIYDKLSQTPKEYKLNGESVTIMSQNEILSIIRK